MTHDTWQLHGTSLGSDQTFKNWQLYLRCGISLKGMHDYSGIGLTYLSNVCFYCSFLLLLLVLLLVLLSCYCFWHIFPGVTSNNPKCSWLFWIHLWIILKVKEDNFLPQLSFKSSRITESCHSWWENLLHTKTEKEWWHPPSLVKSRAFKPK